MKHWSWYETAPPCPAALLCQNWFWLSRLTPPARLIAPAPKQATWPRIGCRCPNQADLIRTEWERSRQAEARISSLGPGGLGTLVQQSGAWGGQVQQSWAWGLWKSYHNERIFDQLGHAVCGQVYTLHLSNSLTITALHTLT